MRSDFQFSDSHIENSLQTLAPSYEQALRKARREERITEAALRRKRAEIARLIALGQEATAVRLIASLDDSNQRGVSTKLTHSKRVEPQQTTAGKPRVTTPTESPPRREHGKSRTAPSQSKKLKPIRPERRSQTKLEVKSDKAAPKPKRRKWRRKTLVEHWTDWVGRRPPWAVSAVVHVLLLLAFALLTFASLQEPTFTLSASFADDAFDEPLAEIQLVEWESPAESEAPTEESAAEHAALPELELVAIEVSNPLTATPSLTGELPSDPSHLMASAVASEEEGRADEKGKTSDGKQSGEREGNESSDGSEKKSTTPGHVSFFGAQARANRIVFVVDNSGSMQRGRMETALDELNRAVRRLQPTQEFYVIFYSDQAYPMFFPEPIHEMLPATHDNKRRLTRWLGTVEMCLGGRLLDAMDLAARVEPELVYLLSDGDIRSQRVMEQLTQADAWPFTINTLGMAARSRDHAANLVAISEANDGSFTFVDAHPRAVRHSLARPMPYHRKPGQTWGSAVQIWD